MDDPALREYLAGKRVRLVYTRDEMTVTVEGNVKKINLMAILLEVGRQKSVLLLETDWLDSIEEIEPKVTVSKILVRQLGPVDELVVRQHLADRHGFLLERIPTDPQIALAVHADHHGFKLGHQHGDTEPQGRNVPTPEQISERAAQLNDRLVCESCGYERRLDEDGKAMHETADLIMHCEDCKDDEEFAYV